MSTNFDCPDSTSLHVTLSQLQCPYQVDNQATCSFYEREAFCPFGHRSDQFASSDIPPYICVDHLVGKCIAEETCKVPVEWLTRCSGGYHPTRTQMIDLEQLDRLVQEAQQGQVQVADDDDELKCAICLEQVHSPYGLLEDCCHLFCAECIIVWEETDPQKRCPVCRVHSRRVLLWPNTDPILNGHTKLELFRLQARCNGLFHDDNQDLVVPHVQLNQEEPEIPEVPEISDRLVDEAEQERQQLLLQLQRWEQDLARWEQERWEQEEPYAPDVPGRGVDEHEEEQERQELARLELAEQQHEQRRQEESPNQQLATGVFILWQLALFILANIPR